MTKINFEVSAGSMTLWCEEVHSLVRPRESTLAQGACSVLVRLKEIKEERRNHPIP